MRPPHCPVCRSAEKGAESIAGSGRLSLRFPRQRCQEVEMILRDMTRAECEAALSANSIDHLGCISGNRPYVVPIRYVYQKRVFYSFSLPGKKIDSLRFKPHVCVQVEQLATPEEWKSVLLEGLYRELPDDEKDHGEHMRAWRLLQERGNWWEPGAYKPEGVAHPDAQTRPIFYRVEIDILSGRQATLA
jgi:nitroimidazol reductase NimA-like FMN-containing flavoprotein (pyridoxamine 5'-phosphate oxidase superfamily)